MSEAHKNSPLCKELQKRISESLKGKKLSEEMKKKLSDAHMGIPSWNKGLTKEVDERVARNGKAIGEAQTGQRGIRTSWAKGLTKFTDLRMAKRSENQIGCKSWCKGLTKETNESVARQAKALEGRPSWQKGLTKETDERIAKMARTINSPEGKIKHLEAQKKRLINGWISESPKHKFIKMSIAKRMKDLGYNSIIERFVWVNSHHYAVDVYAKKDNNIIIFEVGKCSQSKLLDLMLCYPRVLQVPY